MKRIVSLILLVTVCLGVCISSTSCNKNKGIKVNPDKEEYVVGIIQLITHDALDAATQGFKDALTAKLAEAGRTVKFKEGNAAGEVTQCNTIVNNFVSEDVDLIMANATAALFAAANATTHIPVLGTSVTEYGVALKIDDFDGVVGGNVSGTSDLAPLKDQAQMMIDTLSLGAGSTVGLLYCSAEANSEYQVQVVKSHLESKGVTCTVYKFADSNELPLIAQNAADNSDAIYVPTDNVVAASTEIINNVCAPAKVPVFAGEENTCAGCGYATLSINYYNIGYKTGEMAASVLLGQADISEMPIAYDAEPVKKYNKSACENLGIDISALEAAGYVAIPEA